MSVIKNLENKIKLVLIVSCVFMVGCVVISLGSIVTAKGMVDDATRRASSALVSRQEPLYSPLCH